MSASNSENTASMNVDASEVAKFEKLASRWWDRNSEFKPLHDINPLRANWIDKLAPVAEQKVLDVGCGGGILCEAMAQRGAYVTGIDMGEAHWRWENCINSSPALRWTTKNPLQKILPRVTQNSSMWLPAWKCSNMCQIPAQWCAPVPP